MVRTPVFVGFLVIILLLAGAAAWYALSGEEGTVTGNERDDRGCLAAAGFSYDESVGACVRASALNDDTRTAAAAAAGRFAGSYALTVTDVELVQNCERCFRVDLELGLERAKQMIRVRDGQVVADFGPARPSDESAERTAFGFVQALIIAAQGNPDEQAIADVRAALAAGAPLDVSTSTATTTLATFLGVEAVPDSASVEDLLVSDTAAVLTVGLNYDGAPRQLRDVHLTIEDGTWKVTRVSASAFKGESTPAGALTGSLVINDSGLEPDVWYVAPGSADASGEAVALEFTPDSICAAAEEAYVCIPDELEAGARVTVTGEPGASGAVRVTRLEIE